MTDRRGRALARSEFFPDLLGLAAPVHDPPGAVIASVILGSPLVRLNGQVTSLALPLVAAARAVSDEMHRTGGAVQVQGRA